MNESCSQNEKYDEALLLYIKNSHLKNILKYQQEKLSFTSYKKKKKYKE
jgi:hypothetical protein